MEFTQMPINEYVQELSSKAPIPGGGGTSALAGALGCALGNMVGSLTVGKKAYADIEPQIIDAMSTCDLLSEELLALVECDAEVFAPLARAYRMPKDTPQEKAEKERVMEAALKDAADVPLRIMKKCAEVLEVMVFFAENGSKLAISDAGVGAALAQAALKGAYLNVLINTKAMKDRELAMKLNKSAVDLLERYIPLADDIFSKVEAQLHK